MVIVVPEKVIFHNGKILNTIILLTMLIYPLINPGNPLEMIGVGTFSRPGTYISLYDSVTTKTQTLKLPDAAEKRLASILSEEDKVKMVAWLTTAEVDISGLDYSDTDALLALWEENYDSSIRPKGMTKAERNRCLSRKTGKPVSAFCSFPDFSPTVSAKNCLQ